MANSPQSMHEKPLDFRAPPPSPIATGRRSSFANEEVLSEFLEHSLRVPDLILPDKVFPREKFLENPPRIDFQSLNSKESDSVSRILDSITTIGCFQLVNYGIPSDVIKSTLTVAAGIFGLPSEKRAAVTRSPEKSYGFEEVHWEEEEEEDDSELSEEFVWCRDECFKLEMEGIWPLQYSKFSEKMEALLMEIENVGEKILQVLKENSTRKLVFYGDDHHEVMGSVCYLYRHGRNIIPEDRRANSLRYDVIRMLIRGVDISHCLSLHVCDGASEFHVYSKKGWVSFCPDKDALVVTAGDQLQASSDGQYKHVIGKAIFEAEKEECISMAFLYSPPSIITTTATSDLDKGNTISLTQQLIIAIFSTLFFRARKRERDETNVTRSSTDYRIYEYHFSAMDSWNEFTIAEIIEMENMYKDVGKECLSREFCQAVATSFSFSASRAAKPAVTWEQVQSWFQDKLEDPKAEIRATPRPRHLNLLVDFFGDSAPSNMSETSQKPKGNRINELKELTFEAKSARDHAWYDVASFLTYRVLHNGELEVRVRFSGFTNTDDEWVNVRHGVRERSIPLEPSECHRVNVGDLILCFQDREDQAVYCDARVLDIRREMHDIGECGCSFFVRYDRDGIEEEVELGRICCRPS
ncbi:hypothetical protein QYF36_007688 [Acer negundo]|nr:hypothetical protein QYF36_007688 [Acer negundo]